MMMKKRMADSLRVKPSSAIWHPHIKVSNLGTQYVDYSEKAQKSAGKPDSILEIENRFRSAGIG